MQRAVLGEQAYRVSPVSAISGRIDHVAVPAGITGTTSVEAAGVVPDLLVAKPSGFPSTLAPCVCDPVMLRDQSGKFGFVIATFRS